MDPIPVLADRAEESHKGDYGRALLIGGSRGMAGAIALTGMGTLRSGAGLVSVAVPDVCLETVASWDPCYMTIPLPCDEEGRLAAEAEELICKLAARATACACGPGLGRSDVLDRLVRMLYTQLPNPMVVDADALNALAQDPATLHSPGGPRVLTPHPGEFDRLCGSASVGEGRLESAVDLAARHGVVIVLKGHRTLITDGARTQRNASGNPGMATGGAGDVLTGIITALMCQGLDPWSAARLGVHVHGLSGDIAARRFSQVAMTARDIVSCLSDAWLQLQTRPAAPA